MLNELRAELIKTRRSANSKLKIIVPLVFVVFNLLMGMLMGQSPTDKSYLMATSFNWYPITVLPVVLSLLVVNISSQEKEAHNALQKSIGLSKTRLLFAKNTVVLLELLAILTISSIAIYIVGNLVLRETIDLIVLLQATVVLFIGSLPIIGISFLAYSLFKKKLFVVFMNFILTFPAAIVAVTYYWKLFPWAFNLRMLAPIIGVHPNGTFLQPQSALLDIKAVYIGSFISAVVYLLALGVIVLIDWKRAND